MSKTFDEWRKEAEHMPPFMRDFHDQKDLFKYIGAIVDKENKGGHRDLGITWVDGHIYTVDFFLWLMAAHGYTLQKSRKKFAFRDINETLKNERERQLEAFSKMINERGNSTPSGEPQTQT